MFEQIEVFDYRADEVGQRLITRYRFKNLFSHGSVGSSAAAYINGDRIDDFSSDVRPHASQADVCCLVIAAARRASGPMNAKGISAGAETLFESFGKFVGAALGLNQGEVAIVGARAGYQLAKKWRRRMRKLLKQGFREQGLQAFCGNIGNNGVLSSRQTDVTIAVRLCQARQLQHLLGIQAAGGDAESHGYHACLPLIAYSQMIAVV